MPEVWSSSLQTRGTQHGRSTGSVREPRFHFQPPCQPSRMPNPALGRRCDRDVRSSLCGWEGSAAGRGVLMLPRSAEPCRAGRTERSSAAATGPTQVAGRVHSHRSGAIPGMGISLISGTTRPPAGLFRAAPSARGPGEEPPEAPGSRLTSRGRRCWHGRPPAPPRGPRRPRCHGEDHCLG
ncbi:hypothetical protein NDU88_002898 [Pleurodeles waltl]|uniref:Uncharacterized protein n=1 Tax=Pleurodeles waltl TaxID=8319 RepID=A0AAV7WTR3_PLEWA|nr:hypothetical protein NDU88_002898 [Pleurodeles waltl]